MQWLDNIWRKNSVVDAMHFYLHFILKVSLFGRADGLSISHFPFPATMWLQSGMFINSLQCLRYRHWLKFYALHYCKYQTLDSMVKICNCLGASTDIIFYTSWRMISQLKGATLKFSEIHVCTIVSLRYLRKNWVCQIHFSARWGLVDQFCVF